MSTLIQDWASVVVVIGLLLLLFRIVHLLKLAIQHLTEAKALLELIFENSKNLNKLWCLEEVADIARQWEKPENGD